MDDVRAEVTALLRRPAAHRDPAALYERLAGSVPVLDLGRLTVVSGHQEIALVAAHPATRVDPAQLGLTSPDRGRLTRLTSAMLPLRDGPDHTRLKRLALAAFSHRKVALQASRVDALTSAALSSALTDGACDLVADVAVPLPVTLTCELLDIPFDDRHLLLSWASLLVDALAPGAVTTPEAEAGFDALADYVARLCERRRRAPGADLISRLVAVHDEGGLDDDELLAFVVLLLTNGVETLTSGLSGVAWQVLRHPSVLDLVRAEPESATDVADEALRLSSPVRGSARGVLADVVGPDGTTLLTAGSVAVLLYAAANRDPRRFPDPHAFVPGRPGASHLAFGTGPHRCLGAPLALQTCAALVRGLAGAGRVSTPLTPDTAQWGEQFAFGGLKELPLAVERAPLAGARR